MTDAYWEGYHAKWISKNPYQGGTREYSDWEDGKFDRQRDRE